MNNRRDFLKLISLLPAHALLSKAIPAQISINQGTAIQNVLVVVFDTFTATHLSIYGYPRQTTPNISRIIEKATVYHNHHAAGNWTTPGTASLLTGTYPWTHRAFSERDEIAKDKQTHTIFNTFKGYQRLGYSHNSIVDRFLHQLYDDIEILMPQKDLFAANPLAFERYFEWDRDISSISWDRIVNTGEKGYTYSLFFSWFYNKYKESLVQKMGSDFPRGIPHTGEDSYFLLEDGINWLTAELKSVSQPFFGYFHYLPPHRPYNTREEFVGAFEKDSLGYYIEKPKHPFFSPNLDKPQSMENQAKQMRLYDEFILYVDAEFGRLYSFMEENGLLENTWLVMTSDHGEMFERGIFGHKTPLLYEPVVHIPLLIMQPGQKTRQDVYVPTSAVDVLPTLAAVTGQPYPQWTEGKVLPPFSDEIEKTERSIFALEASDSQDDKPLNPASVMMVKGKYKLTYYFGYEQLGSHGPLFELYDLEKDPQELNDIYSEDSDMARAMRAELLAKVDEVNKPYQTE